MSDENTSASNPADDLTESPFAKSSFEDGSRDQVDSTSAYNASTDAAQVDAGATALSESSPEVDPEASTKAAPEVNSKETSVAVELKEVIKKASSQFSIKRPLLLLGIVFALLIFNLAFSQSDFYKLKPGPAPDVTANVKGTPPNSNFGKGGHFFFTTVEVEEINWWEWARLKISSPPGVSLIPASDLGSGGQAERAAAASAQMKESKDAAYLVASTQLSGQSAKGDGAKIVLVALGSAAERAGITPGDVITSIDGKAITSDIAAKEAVRKTQNHTFTLLRNKKEREVQVDLDQVDNEFRLGVELSTNVEAPDKSLDISTDGVGGPSGGLLFSLTFTDALSQGDLTGGQNISGTGTISPDGTVGPIGGVEDKVIGAKEAGATLFFAPKANFEKAKTSAPKGLKVVEVDTYSDALNYLCMNGAKSTACTSAAGK